MLFLGAFRFVSSLLVILSGESFFCGESFFLPLAGGGLLWRLGRRKSETPAFPKRAIHLSPVFSQGDSLLAVAW